MTHHHHRNFGIRNATTRATSGGQLSRGPHYSAGTRADLLSFPSGSILKPVEFSEPPVHIFEPRECKLLGFTLALALFVALALLFVDLS